MERGVNPIIKLPTAFFFPANVSSWSSKWLYLLRNQNLSTFISEKFHLLWAQPYQSY